MNGIARAFGRWTWGFFTSPTFPFAVDFLIAAPFVLGADHPYALPLSLFASPWLMAAIGMLHLPFLAVAFRRFELDSRIRRNHALEHATIHFLWAAGLRQVGGRAEKHGFRVNGRGASAHAIQSAFGRVARLVRQGEPLPCVSPHCGSNRVTTAAFGLVLLLGATGLSLWAAPPLAVRILVLAGVVALFALLRDDVGNWAQDRFFLATDFKGAWIRAIRGVKPSFGETAPVYFVQTVVTH